MERKPWSKWRYLGVYWAIQAAATYIVVPLYADFPDVGAAMSFWRSLEFAAWAATGLLIVMGLQGVLLVPVRPPGRASGGERAWGMYLLGGAAVGAIASCLSLIFYAMAEAVWGTPGYLPDSRWPAVTLAPFAVVAPIAAVVLRKCWPERMPAVVSASVVAAAAGTLVLALLLTLASVTETLMEWRAPARILAIVMPFAAFLTWAVATPLLLAFIRRREDALGRLAARLLLGTVIETAAIIPLDVMVRRKSDCYCFEGSLFAMVLCWGVGTLVLGPWIWLVPLGRRRKRWAMGHCEACGYDMTGRMDAERCPECGAGWRPAAPTA